MTISAQDLVTVDGRATTVVGNPAPHVRRSVVLKVAGVTSAVHFDDTRAARRFAARFADLTAPGEQPAHHAFAIRDPLLGPLFWSDRGPIFCWPHGDLADHVIVFLADAVALSSLFRERADGVVALHAAAVGIPGAAAALIGETNAGKTTTAIACARLGLRLYSDERCVLDRDGRVHPFPRAINVRERGLALLLRDAAPADDPLGERLRAHGPGDWSDVRFRDLLAHWTIPEPAPLRAVFVVTGTSARVGLEPTRTGNAVIAAARFAHGAGAGIDKIARLHALFRSAACYRLELGSPDATARAIRDALQASREREGP